MDNKIQGFNAPIVPLEQRAFYMELYVERKFYYRQVSHAVGTADMHAREKLWNKLLEEVDIRWKEENRDIEEYTYSEECWLPLADTDYLPKLSLYPWRGHRKLDSLVRRYFLDPYIEGTNMTHIKAIKLCGNHLCCNPSHHLLVPKATKSVLEDSSEDYLDLARKAMIAYLSQQENKRRVDSTDLLRVIERALVRENRLDEMVLNREDQIKYIFEVYGAGPTTQLYIRRLVTCTMKGLVFDSERERLGAELRRHEDILKVCGYKKGQISKEQTDKIVDRLKNTTSRRSISEIEGYLTKMSSKPETTKLPGVVDADYSGIEQEAALMTDKEQAEKWNSEHFLGHNIGIVNQEDTPAMACRVPVDENGNWRTEDIYTDAGKIGEITYDEAGDGVFHPIIDEEDLELDKVTYNGTQVDKMEDDELRASLLESGMSDEEVNAILEGDNIDEV